MKYDVKAPTVGESITEVSILKWNKQSGQAVKPGDMLLEIESDKATVEVVAENAGVLTILKQAGERIPVGELIAQIDDAATATTAASAPAASAAPKAESSPAAVTGAAALGTVSGGTGATLSPAVRKVVADQGIDPSQLQGTGKGGRITKGDVVNFQEGKTSAPAAAQAPAPSTAKAPAPATPAPMVLKAGDRRVPMTMLRARIAERLVQAQHTAAILTTFNEVDMSEVNAIRSKHKEPFKAKHGVNLSYMSFFTRASVEALKLIPEVNATVDGKDVIYHDYYDVGIAVGSDRGLVVPVVRDAGKMGFVEIEKTIAALAVKARDGKLSIADMSGGTFTISNGGTYGSLLSTPILNAPQSGILGMHKIQDRPVAINGKIEIRPMMYLALSYDHRLIDGKGAVTFLVHLKDFLENPAKLGLEY
jgi:2-oxoglutarate dehydrogenase E2 component (dihydrolipoamide succinyltransferase)